MDDDELEEFLEEKPFSKAQKRDIANAGKRLDKYREISERYKYSDAMNKIRDFNIAFRKQGIFVHSDIKKDMSALIQLIRNAVTEHQTNQEDKPRPRLREDYKELEDEGNILFERIEQAVVDRLWDSTNTEV
jgi:hemerythrin superfamily protein